MIKWPRPRFGPVALTIVATLLLPACSAKPPRDDSRWRLPPYTTVTNESDLIYVDIDNPPRTPAQHRLYLNARLKIRQALASDRDIMAKKNPADPLCADFKQIRKWLKNELFILQEEFASPSDVYGVIVYIERALNRMYLADSCSHLVNELQKVKAYSQAQITLPTALPERLDYHAVRIAHLNVFLNNAIADHAEASPTVRQLNRAIVDCIKPIRLHSSPHHISSRVAQAQELLDIIEAQELDAYLPRSIFFLIERELKSITTQFNQASLEQIQAYCASTGTGRRFEALSGLPEEPSYNLNTWITTTYKRFTAALPHQPGEELGF